VEGGRPQYMTTLIFILLLSRACLPDPVKAVLEEGLNLYKLHTKRHGRMESTKGSYANDWVKWEKQLRETLLRNSEYLSSIQVPFGSAVNSVLEQLKTIIKGDYIAPSTEKKRLGAIVFAGVSLPIAEIRRILNDVNTLKMAHVTLAHKRSHGVIAVANYGQFVNRKVDVKLTALLFSDNLAAFEACLGSVDGEKINSKNEWPHVTLWTASGVAAKEASTLPRLVLEGKACRIEIDPPVVIDGEVEFF
ncbi:tRNA ligase 1, partial [Bienertia sinuspersici]